MNVNGERRSMKAWVGGLLAAAVCVLAGNILFSAQDEDSSYRGSDALERVKRLAGKWEAQNPRKPDQRHQVEYEVTSGGSAVLERLFPGTPQEIISVYHDKGGNLAVTHYSTLYNQPQLELKSSRDDEIKLELAPGSGVPSYDRHIHELTLIFPDEEHVTQKWISYDKGKPKGLTTLNLTRKTKGVLKVFKKAHKLILGD